MIPEPALASSEVAPAPAFGMEDLTKLLFGHAAFQYLHAGSSLGVLEMLGQTPGLTATQMCARTALAPEAMRCLLFGLSAVRIINKAADHYYPSATLQTLIESGEWGTIKHTIAFEAEIVYAGQIDFVASLRANQNVGLRRIPGEGPDLYHRLTENPDLHAVFYRYMSAWSAMANPHLLRHVDFGRWAHVIDAGGGDGLTAVQIAQRHPNVSVTLLEVPGNESLALQRVAAAGLKSRVRVVGCDMFTSPLPTADCVLFAHQLVIWPLPVVRQLLRAAHDALPVGGGVVIFSSMSDDSGDGPLMAALDSVYFVSIPASRGLIYSFADYRDALEAEGFGDIRCVRCDGWSPHGVVTASRQR